MYVMTRKELRFVGTLPEYKYPTYEDESGNIYVDVELTKDPERPIKLCTTYYDSDGILTAIGAVDFEYNIINL